MSVIQSIDDIILPAPPGKTYLNIEREWREEFIYFLMVDRFHDAQNRAPLPTNGRTKGFATSNAFYGGKIKGITSQLAYIAGLGCTAIWLSPVFENTSGAYHGYSIENYLNIDSNFGTKQDLIDLVNQAHNFKLNGKPYPIRIILDVVLNHSGDNWFYKNDQGQEFWPMYSGETPHPFGGWRNANNPVPTELRNPDLYHRLGQMDTNGGFDRYPENQHGDMYGLKDYNNDDNDFGSELINILIKAHCYWIREADIDGFRVDALKHMGELACARFCSNIREYAYSLGKRNFFLFGEAAVASDDVYNRYLGQNTTKQEGVKTIYYGINSLLDFRLAEGVYGDDDNAPLRDVIKGNKTASTLFNRHAAQQDRALNHGESGKYLVTFIDNHDSFWQPDGRIAANCDDGQVIGAIGYLLCNLGTPCIYYGTEQGFDGRGNDEAMREAMFDLNQAAVNCMNTNAFIYQEIAKIAGVMRNNNPLRFGRIYYREISGDHIHFGLPNGTAYTLAFSRLLYGQETLVAFNVSDQPRQDYVIVDASYHKAGEQLNFLYGDNGSVQILGNPDGTLYVQLNLTAHQFVILQ